MTMRWRTVALNVLFQTHIVAAQPLTPDPGSWRPLVHADLQRPSSATATFAELWRDAIEENNRTYRAQGDLRYGDTNAPVIEAHFVIWSPQKSVVLSVLDTATGCTLHQTHPLANARVKFCPMRIAFYEGIRRRTLDGGHACFLELLSPKVGIADAAHATSLAAYDVATKTIRLGLLIGRQPVDGCSRSVPLYPP